MTFIWQRYNDYSFNFDTTALIKSKMKRNKSSNAINEKSEINEIENRKEIGNKNIYFTLL